MTEIEKDFQRNQISCQVIKCPHYREESTGEYVLVTRICIAAMGTETSTESLTPEINGVMCHRAKDLNKVMRVISLVFRMGIMSWTSRILIKIFVLSS